MRLSDLDALIEGMDGESLPASYVPAEVVQGWLARLREWRANAVEAYVTPENGWGNRVFTIDRTWDDQHHALVITTPREEAP